MLPKPPLKLVSTVVALVFLSGTVAYAASPSTLPTSPFYPLKRAWEGLTVAFAMTPDAKAQALIDLANARLAEAKTLAAQAKTDPSVKSAVAQTVKDSQSSLSLALDNAKKIEDATKRKETLDEISKEADDNKQEIENEVEKEAELE